MSTSCRTTTSTQALSCFGVRCRPEYTGGCNPATEFTETSTQTRCDVPDVEEVGKATVCYYEDVCCPTGGGMLSASNHGDYGTGQYHHQQQSSQQQQYSNRQHSNTNSNNGWESEWNSHYVGGQQHQEAQDPWESIEWDLRQSEQPDGSSSSSSNLNDRESAWLDAWNANKGTTNSNNKFISVEQHSMNGDKGRMAGVFFAMMAIVVVLVYTAMFYKRSKEENGRDAVVTSSAVVDGDLESREGGEDSAIVPHGSSGRSSRSSKRSGSRRSRKPKQRTIYDDSESDSSNDDKSFDESNSSFSYEYEEEDGSYDGSSTLPSLTSNYREKVAAACV